MSKSNWNMNEHMHGVKREANDFVFSLYRNIGAVNMALSMPSLSCGCMKQCMELGIFNDMTRHIVIEKGGFKHNGKSVTYEYFRRELNSMINSIFSTNKLLHEHCSIHWGELGDGITNIGKRYEANSIEWGNYDTCSFLYSVDYWLKYHLVSFRRDAPIILTFDADYTNQFWNANKESILFHDTTRNRGVLTKWFGMENIERHCHNEELLDIVENVKINGMVNYLTSIGIDVDFAGCYREFGNDNGNAKLMMIFSGRKKK